MRNKKLIAVIAVLLLVVFMLSLALVACDKTKKGTNNENEEETPNRPSRPPSDDDDDDFVPPETNTPPLQSTSFRNAMEYIVAAMPSEYMSLNFSGFATVNGVTYRMTFGANLSDDDLQAAATFKDENTGELAYAIYVVNSRLFIQVGAGEDAQLYNIAEIDVNYLLSIVNKLPDVIGDLLGSIDLGGMDITSILNTAINVLLNNLSDPKRLVYTNTDGVESFTLPIDIQGLITPIMDMLGKDGLLSMFLPADLGLDFSFVSTLLGMIPLINGQVKATVDNGTLTEFSLELYDNDPNSDNYKGTVLGIESQVTFGSQPLDLGIPEELNDYESLTLGNLNFDLSLSLNTGDESFDIGALVDAFLDSPLFGEGLLVLDAHADYRLDIKASIDPNLIGSAADNNYINVMFFSGEHELVRANYLDGYLYIKALGEGVNGFAEGGVNVKIKLPLKEYIAQLVELITGYIDGFLGTQYNGGTKVTSVLTTSVDSNGEVILSAAWEDVLVGILGMLGMSENCVSVENDHVTLFINQELFDAIGNLAGVEINYPIFGALTVGVFKGGIEYIEISAMDIITFRADGFGIGKAKIDRDDILASIGNKDDYNADVEGVILSFALNLLSDLDVSLALDVSTIYASVNLTTIINAILSVANSSTYLALPITLDLSRYSGTFNIRIASNYDEATALGRILFEVYTPNGDLLIGAYNEGSSTYVDLEGLGFMKFCLTNVDLFKLIRDALGAVDLLGDEYLEDAEEGDTFLSSGLDIESDNISVAAESILVTKILRMLSMDIGLDLGLNAHLSFDGSVNAELALGEAAKIGLRLTLGKESESGLRGNLTTAEAINGLAKQEFGEYNALGPDLLVDGILDSENLYFTIDLYNQNVDNPSHENKTRIVIRRSTAVRGGVETLRNGMEAPFRALVIEVFDGWTNRAESALLYAYIDFDNKKVQFKGTANMLSVTILPGVYTLTGDVLDIGIDDVDLRGMLVDAVSGIFEDSGYVETDTSGIIDVNDADLPAQKPPVVVPPTDEEEEEEETTEDSGEGIDIMSLLSGVRVSLAGNMDIDVDVDLNGVYFSKFLKDMLQDVFTDLDMGEMTGTGPITLNYNNVETDVFFNDMYSKMLLPLIQKQVGNMTTSIIGSIVSGIASSDGVKSQVHALVQRFLPLPNVDTLTVNVSLTDGKLADISVIGSNTADFTDPEDKGTERKQNLGFGIYIFNKKAERSISWEGQATSIYYNRNFNVDMTPMFQSNVRVHTADNWETDSFFAISWTVQELGLDLDTFKARILIADVNNPNYIPDGEYTIVGTANVTSLSRTDSLSVKFVLDSTPVDHIKDFEVKATRDLPNYVTAVFKSEDGDGNEVETERIISPVTIGLQNGRVTSENNAYVDLGDQRFSFTITFEDEGFTLDTLQLTAYDYIDKLTAMEEAGTISVKVNDSFYRVLPAEFDWRDIHTGVNVKEIDRYDAQKEASYIVKVHVGAGTSYECDLDLKIVFKPFDIYYIERNGLNYIETDFIEYAYGESFPSEITVVGRAGNEYVKYTATVSQWDISGVIVDLKGGQYFASAIINEGEYNQWVLNGIEVRVLSSDIVSLASSSKTVTFDWKYGIYGGVDFDKCVTSLLNFKTSSNTVRTNVPVTIDLSNVYNSNAFARAFAGEDVRVDCPVSVDVKGADGKSLFETTVTVIVPSIKMSLLEDEITIDVSDKNFDGLVAYFKALSKMEIMLGDDIVNANVTWVTDDVIVGVNGEYKATVFIDRQGDYEQSCSVTVRIIGNAETNEEV